MDAGASRAAALHRAELIEFLRRLPEIARTFRVIYHAPLAIAHATP